jgi:hypothetical protein
MHIPGARGCAAAALVSAAICCADQAGSQGQPQNSGSQYEAVAFPFPCPMDMPPLRDHSDCPVAEIGSSIRLEDVCQLAEGLKRWMNDSPPDLAMLEPGDWQRIRSLEVCRRSVQVYDGEGIPSTLGTLDLRRRAPCALPHFSATRRKDPS